MAKKTKMAGVELVTCAYAVQFWLYSGDFGAYGLFWVFMHPVGA